jgi:hypothetical protein
MHPLSYIEWVPNTCCDSSSHACNNYYLRCKASESGKLRPAASGIYMVLGVVRIDFWPLWPFGPVGDLREPNLFPYIRLALKPPRAVRQLVYIKSYSSPLLPFSSLLSLVSSIVAIYKADYSRILYVLSHYTKLFFTLPGKASIISLSIHL